MQIGNVAGRLALLGDAGALDVERASGGRFSADPQPIYDDWDEFCVWAKACGTASAEAYDHRQLGPPAPAPRQIFAIGLNYREHAREAGLAIPEQPVVFTKFVTSIAGPYDDVVVPAGSIDWEVELVVVMGRRAERVKARDAWSYIAGVTVGQDLSERESQRAGPVPQFSLAKSFPSFGPIGPWLVTVDELAHPDDLELGCSVNGEEMQKGRTSDMIFGVPELVSSLSAVLPLLPGDVIFTGTPPGVGFGRTPPRYLVAGDELVSFIEGIGETRHRMVRG